jgi:PAS domain S-box-containing protein
VKARSRTFDSKAKFSLPSTPLAEAALYLLEDGIAIVDAGGRVAFANPAMEQLLGAAQGRLTSLDPAAAFRTLSLNAEVLASVRVGEPATPRRIERVQNGRATVLEVSVARVIQEALLIRAKDVTAEVEAERRAHAQEEENESFRVVACLLAEESDLHEVLKLLSAQAASQCDADGGTVIQIQEERGRAVASVGILAPLHGREFLVGGSLAERAIRLRMPVAVDDFLREYPNHPWTDAALEVNAGPILFAPLFAHDSLMGIVTVARLRGTEPFGHDDVRRIRALADQAALALWKAQLLERAEAANRAKNDFIAVMSHELRTPLAAVTGYEELLADEILGALNEEQHNAIDRMRWSTRLLTSIIEEVLTFSRLEAGEVHLNIESIGVADLLSSAGAVLEPLATARSLDFAVELPEDSLAITTDADVVRRVLVNLGSNAIKFTQSGSIVIGVRTNGDRICLDVHDTGIGIAPGDVKRIFEAFTQVHTGTARPYGGTGLGLHTAHRLARLIGGEIGVESEVGEGSTFSLRLPVDSGD